MPLRGRARGPRTVHNPAGWGPGGEGVGETKGSV